MHNMNKVKMLSFKQNGDDRGHLVVIEGNKDVPFDIKRIFYIYGSDPNVIRGQHANRETEFVLVNVAGKSKVKVYDGKGNEAIFILNRPHTGIYLPTMRLLRFQNSQPKICMISQKTQCYWCLQVKHTIQMST